MNLVKEDLLGIHKDRMKIGASLADVDPMQIDKTVGPLWRTSALNISSMEHAQIQRLRLNGTKVFWNVKPFTLSRTVLNLYFVCRM